MQQPFSKRPFAYQRVSKGLTCGRALIIKRHSLYSSLVTHVGLYTEFCRQNFERVRYSFQYCQWYSLLVIIKIKLEKKNIYIYYIYRDATNYGQSGLILLWLNFTSYSWTVIINSFCNTSMYLYGSANKACSCCCWIRNFNIHYTLRPNAVVKWLSQGRNVLKIIIHYIHYTLRPNAVVKWLSQGRNVLKIICCVEER